VEFHLQTIQGLAPEIMEASSLAVHSPSVFTPTHAHPPPAGTESDKEQDGNAAGEHPRRTIDSPATLYTKYERPGSIAKSKDGGLIPTT